MQGDSKVVGESGKDDYGKFSLPTGSGFIEDTLRQVRAVS